ncbi:AMP-binding protein [Niabella hirudinis]|uniref:AMP-binding protein n=1 Tax=Niabella hirudinis TaxID=1285929 RepID=UPI003EB8B107
MLKEKMYPGIYLNAFYNKGYRLEIIQGNEQFVQKGYLLDPLHIEAIPIIHNLIFFNEADLFIESMVHLKIDALYEAVVSSEAAYKQFIRTKSRKPLYDVYACFQPFNEAFKSFYPFIKLLRTKLKKGDVIIDLWNRSGWSAALLAGLFPEQQVVTIWEGNKDVLGYKGFQHWFAHTAANIQVIFHDLNKPLPFADNSVAFVYGLDALHRFDQASLLKELLRITTREGAIICPHVHLSNSEPVPFFERGCRQLHGLQYDALFKKMTGVNPALGGFVFSEPGLFAFNELSDGHQRPLVSEPDTEDYNALVALLPQSWSANRLEPFDPATMNGADASYILVNPLFNIDLSVQEIKIDPAQLSGAVGKLLSRHPVYEKRISTVATLQLNDQDCKLLYLASRFYSLQQIRRMLQTGPENFQALLKKLSAHDIIQVVPVQQNFARLQQFLSTQEYILSPQEQTLPALWQRACELFADNVFLYTVDDESEFKYGDVDLLIQKTIATLIEKKIQKGDRISLVGPFHPEQVILFWAAMHIGAVVVPLGYELPSGTLDHIFREISPALVLADEERLKKIPAGLHARCVLVDSEEDTDTPVPSFSGWLSENDIAASTVTTVPTDLAVILYTSGSTGLPKGVMLTQGHLVRSARQMTETYSWEATDRFYAMGGPDSMSGLRNGCIAPVEVGAAVVIPSKGAGTTPRDIAAFIEASGTTIIATSPALLSSLAIHQQEVKARFTKLRLVLSTGSPLSPSLKKTFFERFQLPVYNYYGLTETTGICIAESPAEKMAEGSIGRPVSCIAQVVDENGQVLPKGKSGELRIYSENITPGYRNMAALTNAVIRNGWFYTGDMALINEDGTIKLMGRKNDFIKSPHSEIIYASEIESCLQELPGIKAVSACRFEANEAEKMAVFVVQDAFLPHEAIIATVKNHIAQTLGNRKIPAVVMVVDELPYGKNQKVLKSKLIDLL